MEVLHLYLQLTGHLRENVSLILKMETLYNVSSDWSLVPV